MQHQHFLGRLKCLTAILNEELQGDVRYKVAERMFNELPDTTEFEERPTIFVSNSEGGLKRNRSCKGLEKGLLPGDEPFLKVLCRKRVEKSFTKLVNKYMNLE